MSPRRDPDRPGRRTEPVPWDLLAAVAAGGVLGAEARYGLGQLLPRHGAQFPWATLCVNVTGCLLLGVLMQLLLAATAPHRLLRPLLGVGVLGGYTTFSSFAVEAQTLLRAHRAPLALGYVAASVLCCLLAVSAGMLAVQGLGRVRRPARAGRSPARRS